MELNPKIKKILIVLSIALLVLILIYYYYIAKKNTSTSSPEISITPTKTPNTINIVSKNLEDAPKLAPEKGGGLDISSNVLKESALNIEKIISKLPYNKNLTSNEGVNIEILIPNSKYQENRWTLLVNIFGIDYEVPAGTPEYVAMRNAFREGAADVFAFIKDSGADPEKIIIKWGDRSIVEDRAIEWVK
ncbi:hypothetical protein BH09PAT2_BH09PAT2_00310 [soil metagenome]